MAELGDLNIADANNQGRWPTAIMTINQVDDAGRALEGMIARDYRDIDGTNTTTGTGAAYTLTLNRSGITAAANTGKLIIRAHVANTGAATLAINGLSAIPITKRGGAALIIGDIQTNDILLLVYNPARNNFQIVGV
jgi:hypothetical protein